MILKNDNERNEYYLEYQSASRLVWNEIKEDEIKLLMKQWKNQEKSFDRSTKMKFQKIHPLFSIFNFDYKENGENKTIYIKLSDSCADKSICSSFKKKDENDEIFKDQLKKLGDTLMKSYLINFKYAKRNNESDAYLITCGAVTKQTITTKLRVFLNDPEQIALGFIDYNKILFPKDTLKHAILGYKKQFKLNGHKIKKKKKCAFCGNKWCKLYRTTDKYSYGPYLKYRDLRFCSKSHLKKYWIRQ